MTDQINAIKQALEFADYDALCDAFQTPMPQPDMFVWVSMFVSENHEHFDLPLVCEQMQWLARAVLLFNLVEAGVDADLIDKI